MFSPTYHYVYVNTRFCIGKCVHARLSLFSIYNPVQYRTGDIYIYILLYILHTQLLINTRNDKLGQFAIDCIWGNYNKQISVLYTIFIIYTCILLYRL